MQEKLKKIELNEEFIAMCRGEEQNLWNVISPSEILMKEFNLVRLLVCSLQLYQKQTPSYI